MTGPGASLVGVAGSRRTAPDGRGTTGGPGTVLALDVGGTKLAVGIADATSGEWLALRRGPTPPDGVAGLAALCSLADEVVRQATDEGAGQVRGIGVSFGGHVDSATGVVRRSVQVPGWEDVPLSALLADRFGARTELCNDGTAGAVGEWADGAGRGLSNLVYLTVSTGVGGGLVLDGRPYEGTAGFAAELGHLPVREGDETCACGLSACLETVAAGPALARAAAARLAAGEESVLATLDGPLDGIAVSAAALEGDRLAREVLERAGRAVAEVVSTLVIALDPQAVLVGGGVAHAAPPFWDAFRASIRTPATDDRWVRIGAAQHIDDAPLIGARAIGLRLARGDRAS